MKLVCLLAILSFTMSVKLKRDVDTSFCDDEETYASEECVEVRRLEYSMGVVSDILAVHCLELGFESSDPMTVHPLEGLLLETAMSILANDVSDERAAMFETECSRHSKFFITAVAERLVEKIAKEIDEKILSKSRSIVAALDNELTTVLSQLSSVSDQIEAREELIEERQSRFAEVLQRMMSYEETEGSSTIMFFDPMIELLELSRELAECDDSEIHRVKSKIHSLLDGIEGFGFAKPFIREFCHPSIVFFESVKNLGGYEVPKLRKLAEELNEQLGSIKIKLNDALEKHRRELSRTGISLVIQKPNPTDAV